MILKFRNALAVLATVAALCCFPKQGYALCLYDCEPPEFTALKTLLLTPSKGEWAALCGPWSIDMLQVGAVTGSPPSNRIRKSMAAAEAGFKLGYFQKQGGMTRTYVPTAKLTSLKKVAGKENCYEVEKKAKRTNVKFVGSRDLVARGENAKEILFTYDRDDGPFVLAFSKELYNPSIENGTRKGRCLATYDAFKKTWKFDLNDLCDWAGIDGEFKSRSAFR